MDFSWSEEQLELRRAVIEFAQKELNDDLITRDKNSNFSFELWQKCADFGILGLPHSQRIWWAGARYINSRFGNGRIGVRM